MIKTNSKKNRNIVAITLIFSIFLLILLGNIKISVAEDSKNSLIIPLKFQIFEFSDKKRTINNKSTIDIELPSSTWDITYLEMNFTNIEYYNREIKVVEDNSSNGDLYLSKNGIEDFGVQIKLNDTVTIYGVYLNIKTKLPHTLDALYVQIRGYNSSINTPNNTIYGQVDLNNTLSDGWNYQNFTLPITLLKGNYSLVFGGFIQAAGHYYWYCNDFNPNNPDLYRSENDGSGWINGIQGSPFLYKLDQEILSRDVYPEEFNMTAEIKGNSYKILNNNQKGAGILKLDNIEYSANNEILHIPIKPNRFFFTLSYFLKLKNQFLSSGSVKITEKEDNFWKITPNINRCNYNYSIKIQLPDNWFNLNVFKDNTNITASKEVVINENVLYILNDTINNVAFWEITAKSPKIDFTLDRSRGTEFKLGEELIFSAMAPTREGNFTFLLYNELGAELDKKVLPVTSDETIYSFNITSSSSPGNWIAYIYWNNNKDAGVQSQGFSIIDPQIPDPNPDPDPDPISKNLDFPWEILLIILASGGGGTLTVYQAVIRKKRRNELKFKEISNKFKDILNLNYLMISDIKSGVNVYEQFYMGKFVDPSLISGFLDAIRNFGIALTGSYLKSETVSLDYEDSIILMNESDDFRLIIVMSEKPSEEFTNSITNLSKDIQKKYGELLREFKGGSIIQFAGISELIEMHLFVSFASPLKIFMQKKASLNPQEKSIIEKAKEIMKQTNLDYFYTSFLMPDQKFNPEMTPMIFNLINKKIFQPIDLNLRE